jgi:hypothetical protein
LRPRQGSGEKKGGDSGPKTHPMAIHASSILPRAPCLTLGCAT